MSNCVVYHNPRCSKSRQALEILDKKKVPYKIFYYLKEELTVVSFSETLKKLKMSPRDVLRINEVEFKENNLFDKNLTDKQILDVIIKFPKLIERPIVIHGDNAVIARPAKKLLEIL